MLVLINSSQPDFRLILVEAGEKHEYIWSAGRDLAKGILAFMTEKLALHHMTLADISALGVFQGPGSFTGLRIGLTVANTLASNLNIPIVSGLGDDWQDQIFRKLNDFKDEKMVLPVYGAEARITKPKK